MFHRFSTTESIARSVPQLTSYALQCGITRESGWAGTLLEVTSHQALGVHSACVRFVARVNALTL